MSIHWLLSLIGINIDLLLSLIGTNDRLSAKKIEYLENRMERLGWDEGEGEGGRDSLNVENGASKWAQLGVGLAYTTGH